jgi:hypothetical protein
MKNKCVHCAPETDPLMRAEMPMAKARAAKARVAKALRVDLAANLETVKRQKVEATRRHHFHHYHHRHHLIRDLT